MGEGTIDKVKGRATEALGAAKDDDDLRAKGRVEQGKGSLKDTIDDVADKAKRAID